ncbi:hypothetical protein GOFOIKOB_6526 [Methylobacterium tardum]|nr:hypothetical protein GOFOIKOB_6526 [Methylobacterium tardum]
MQGEWARGREARRRLQGGAVADRDCTVGLAEIRLPRYRNGARQDLCAARIGVVGQKAQSAQARLGQAAIAGHDRIFRERRAGEYPEGTAIAQDDGPSEHEAPGGDQRALVFQRHGVAGVAERLGLVDGKAAPPNEDPAGEVARPGQELNAGPVLDQAAIAGDAPVEVRRRGRSGDVEHQRRHLGCQQMGLGGAAMVVEVLEDERQERPGIVRLIVAIPGCRGIGRHGLVLPERIGAQLLLEGLADPQQRLLLIGIGVDEDVRLRPAHLKGHVELGRRGRLFRREAEQAEAVVGVVVRAEEADHRIDTEDIADIRHQRRRDPDPVRVGAIEFVDGDVGGADLLRGQESQGRIATEAGVLLGEGHEIVDRAGENLRVHVKPRELVSEQPDKCALVIVWRRDTRGKVARNRNVGIVEVEW